MVKRLHKLFSKAKQDKLPKAKMEEKAQKIESVACTSNSGTEISFSETASSNTESVKSCMDSSNTESIKSCTDSSSIEGLTSKSDSSSKEILASNDGLSLQEFSTFRSDSGSKEILSPKDHTASKSSDSSSYSSSKSSDSGSKEILSSKDHTISKSTGTSGYSSSKSSDSGSKNDLNSENSDTGSKDDLVRMNFEESMVDSDGLLSDEEYVENKFIGRYTILKNLGSGSSSRVVLATHNDTKERVAIKIVSRKIVKKKESLCDDMCDIRIYREIVISSLLKHPHIVRLLDFFYSTSHFFLVFEYVQGRQLYDVVLKNSHIAEPEARRYFRQILSAIDYVHRNSIVHRDLKIENILIDHNDNIKIIDFGLSNFYDNKTMLNTFCGSLYFAAPELLLGQRYCGPEVDIWSLGVVLYVMLCGKVPFDDESVHALQNKIKIAQFDFCKSISADGKDLILNMILAQPSGRYGLEQVKKSKWVNAGYDDLVNNYMMRRLPLLDLNIEYVKALSSALSFQFPDVKEDLESFCSICAEDSSVDQHYWSRRPVISMYYLLLEDIQTEKKVTSRKKKASHDMPSILHNFVQFVFSGEEEFLHSQYFIKNIFKPVDEPKDTPIVWPTVRKSYLKGFFKGIKVKNIGTHNALKKIMLDIFMSHNVVYEANEKSYFCSYFDRDEECYFKVSIYFNVILSEYYLVCTCLNSKKESFKSIYDTIQKSIKSRCY